MHNSVLTFIHSNLLLKTLNYWLYGYSSKSWRKNWIIITFKLLRYGVVPFRFAPVGLKVYHIGHASERIRDFGSGATERDHRSNVMFEDADTPVTVTKT